MSCLTGEEMKSVMHALSEPRVVALQALRGSVAASARGHAGIMRLCVAGIMRLRVNRVVSRPKMAVRMQAEGDLRGQQ